MEFITDRTQADVLLGTEKGSYNFEDLNRVESAVAELSEMFHLGLKTKTNWSANDIPIESEMRRYLSNVEAVRMICPAGTEFPPLPSAMDGLTHEAANNIEKVVTVAARNRARLGKFVVGKTALGGVRR